MQEDKEQIFDAVDTVKLCVPVFEKMISTMKIKAEICCTGAKGGFTNATDVADYLVKRGLPFRDAHAVVGRMVAYCIENDKYIDELSMDEFKEFSELFGEDIYDEISLKTCVSRESSSGGPAKETVKKVVDNYRNRRSPKIGFRSIRARRGGAYAEVIKRRALRPMRSSGEG